MEGNGRERRKILVPCRDDDVDCMDTLLSGIMTELKNITLDNIINDRHVKISVEIDGEPGKIRYEVLLDKNWRLIVPKDSLDWAMSILEGLGLLRRRAISPQNHVDRRKSLGII
ncbi:MAG: hypothetical protein QXE01_05090 [Sulfolobales archaeon]